MVFQSFFPLLVLFFLYANISFANLQNFVIVTPEKSGTHLLTKAIGRLTGMGTHNCWAYELSTGELLNEIRTAQEKNAFLHMHALPTPEIIRTLKQHNYKVVFLMRDPRDVVISLLFYIEKGWVYGPFHLSLDYGTLTKDQKIDELITGRRYHVSAVRTVIERRIPWMLQSSSFVYTVHFENLVGAEGGGSKERQNKEIVNIANHLGVSVTSDDLLRITTGLFGKPGEGTFREGKISSWKNHFTDKHKRDFKKLFGTQLIQLGYEKDSSWAKSKP